MSTEPTFFYLPSIVITEFLSYPLIDPHSATTFRLFVQQTTVVNLDLQIAEFAAEIRKNYNRKLADSVIAATALLTESTLVTRNIADFRKIPNLKLLKV
jgi:predicted nucleic acid-binding protein